MLDKLRHKNHYPAIDVLQSISRLGAIATKEHKNLAGRLKNIASHIHGAEDLINIMVYKSSSQIQISTMLFKELVLLTHSFVKGTDEIRL